MKKLCKRIAVKHFIKFKNYFVIILNPKSLKKYIFLQMNTLTLRNLSVGLRSNSLPRSGRTLPQQPGLRSGLSTVASGLIDQEDSDGALSAPELPSIRRDRGKL